jgi:hypothetical protein
MTLFWLRLMYNFNRKFTNFPLFHPSVNRNFEISIITSFHLYAVVDWLWARLQTSGTRTIAIYLHSQIQKSYNKTQRSLICPHDWMWKILIFNYYSCIVASRGSNTHQCNIHMLNVKQRSSTIVLAKVHKLAGLKISVGSRTLSDSFVKLSDVQRKLCTGHSVRPKWNKGLLFVRPKWIGVRRNYCFVQRKSNGGVENKLKCRHLTVVIGMQVNFGLEICTLYEWHKLFNIFTTFIVQNSYNMLIFVSFRLISELNWTEGHRTSSYIYIYVRPKLKVIGHFVRRSCKIYFKACTNLKVEMFGTVYWKYRMWCVEGGVLIILTCSWELSWKAKDAAQPDQVEGFLRGPLPATL